MGATSTKKCRSFLSLVCVRNENHGCQSILADTCSYCVIVFSAALQLVTLGFLEKISSSVACAGSYMYLFKWKLKSCVH